MIVASPLAGQFSVQATEPSRLKVGGVPQSATAGRSAYSKHRSFVLPLLRVDPASFATGLKRDSHSAKDRCCVTAKHIALVLPDREKEIKRRGIYGLNCTCADE